MKKVYSDTENAHCNNVLISTLFYEVKWLLNAEELNLLLNHPNVDYEIVKLILTVYPKDIENYISEDTIQTIEQKKQNSEKKLE